MLAQIAMEREERSSSYPLTKLTREIVALVKVAESTSKKSVTDMELDKTRKQD